MAVHGYDAVALDHPKNRFGFVYPGNKVEQDSQSYKMSNKQQNLLSNPNNNGLSRLEQLRMGYQERLLHEKEQKLNQLFQTQSAHARRNKSKSGGTVRQFFAERRALENSNYARKNPECLPPIQHHFDKVKQQQRTGDQYDSPQRPNHTTERSRGDFKSVSAPAASVRKHAYQRAKPRVGIDRQNPLPSLKGTSKKEPVYSHYETETTLVNNDLQESGQTTISPHPPVSRSRKSNATYKRPYNRQSPGLNNVDNVKLQSDQIVPEKLSKVKMLRAKRLSQNTIAPGPSPSTMEDSHKLTDFQKWQMEQDEERRQRLEKHRPRQDSENSDLSYSQQERELMEKIRAEKEKLKEIQKEQKDLDEEKRREKEEEEEWLRSQRELERVAEQMERERERLEREKEQMDKDRKQMEKEKKQIEKERKKKELEKSRKVKPVKEKRPVVESPITRTENNFNTGEDDASIDPATENYYKNFYAEQAATLADQEEAPVELAECSNCGRKFAADRLAKHTNVCVKSSQKKRKVFDNRKMRMQGTDMENYLGKKDLGEPSKPIKKSNWRAQHESFVQNIRYAKGQTTEAPPPAQNPDYVQCPHCDRKFNEAAAERHIPRCKDIKAKPTFLKRKK